MSSRDQLLYHLEMEMTCTTVFLRHLSLRPPEAKKQDALVPLSFRRDSSKTLSYFQTEYF